MNDNIIFFAIPIAGLLFGLVTTASLCCAVWFLFNFLFDKAMDRYEQRKRQKEDAHQRFQRSVNEFLSKN